jgi:hypothetical protein
MMLRSGDATNASVARRETLALDCDADRERVMITAMYQARRHACELLRPVSRASLIDHEQVTQVSRITHHARAGQ